MVTLSNTAQPFLLLRQRTPPYPLHWNLGGCPGSPLNDLSSVPDSWSRSQEEPAVTVSRSPCSLRPCARRCRSDRSQTTERIGVDAYPITHGISADGSAELIYAAGEPDHGH